MPKVGMKEFAYTAKGMAMAKKESKKTGKKMVIKKMGKKIVAIREIKSGDMISWEDLGYKSPGDGLSPALADDVIGKRSSRFIQAGETLTVDDFR